MRAIVQMRLVTGCGAVGSAPGLGPGGPRFESAHPDHSRGSNSVVEFLPSKQAVAGSSPVSRSSSFIVPFRRLDRPLHEKRAVKVPERDDVYGAQKPFNGHLPSFTHCLI